MPLLVARPTTKNPAYLRGFVAGTGIEPVFAP